MVSVVVIYRSNVQALMQAPDSQRISNAFPSVFKLVSREANCTLYAHTQIGVPDQGQPKQSDKTSLLEISRTKSSYRLLSRTSGSSSFK